MNKQQIKFAKRFKNKGYNINYAILFIFYIWSILVIISDMVAFVSYVFKLNPFFHYLANQLLMLLFGLNIKLVPDAFFSHFVWIANNPQVWSMLLILIVWAIFVVTSQIMLHKGLLKSLKFKDIWQSVRFCIIFLTF